MSTIHLSPPYLAAIRKQRGFTRDDLGMLIGHEDGRYVARLERGEVFPGLELTIALEIALQAPIESVYVDLALAIKEQVARRADRVARRYSIDERNTSQVATKAKTLAALSNLVPEAV